MKNYDEVISNLKSRNKRLISDYENIKRQKDIEITNIKKTASKDIILSLLPIVDDMERLVSNISADTTVSIESRKAVALLYAKTIGVLKKYGVELIPTIGAQFDPSIHEAIGLTNGGADNTISKCTRAGYTLNEEIIRYPQVYVNKN